MSTLGQGGAEVKRRYDGSRRRAQADASRRRLLAIAERRFLSDGYAGTTIGAIADEGNVSADTIYKSFGGKPGLVRALIADALHGTESEPAATRSERVQREESDPRAIVRTFGAFVAELTPRVAPLVLLVRDAAIADGELAHLRDDLAASRLQRMTENARRLHEAGHLRTGITIEHAAAVMWTYSSAELYELLVLQRGFTPAAYGAFVAEAMTAALL